ncbi:hypothetical protein SBOR_8356 [Sclerotinia borealis F-4128]|uniref:Uncharacterized protein n=1 Tax=Sclerotinia borealis (strain F-4128) TaxID=1432307 RepID=W9C690_SCLBF|nr:hypothetical protein SBOR_8356 [Sclerotinia borealis F-4128]
MGATNTWYCLSCKTSQYGSVSAVRSCKYCNYTMSICHEPGGMTVAVEAPTKDREKDQIVVDDVGEKGMGNGKEKGNAGSKTGKSNMGWWGFCHSVT